MGMDYQYYSSSPSVRIYVFRDCELVGIYIHGLKTAFYVLVYKAVLATPGPVKPADPVEVS